MSPQDDSPKTALSSLKGNRLAARMIPSAVIILLSVVLFSPFIFRGRIFLAGDILYANYPWKAQAPPGFKPHNEVISDPVNHNWAGIYNRQLHQGDLKNWNPYMLLGVPNTGLTAMSGMSGRWYPLKLLFHRLFPTPVALNLLLLVHVTLMGLTMFLYLSEIGAGRRGALFGAVAYMFNGCAMAWLEYESVVAASALLPLLLFCLERLRKRRRRFWTAAGAGVLGMMWLMSHLQYMAYTHLLLGFYFLLLVARRLRQGIGGRGILGLGLAFSSVVALGGLIGAIEILPVVELLRNSFRYPIAYAYGQFYERTGLIPWRQLVTLVFPDYFGNPVLGFTALSTPPSQGLMMFNELALNMGVPTLFALLAAVVAPRVAHARFFLAMALLSLLLMTGSPLAYPFFRFVPGMGKMTPTRIVWLLTFSVAVAGGLGFKSLTALKGLRRKVYLALVLVLTCSVAVLSLASSRAPVISFFNADRLPGTDPATPETLARLTALRAFASPPILRPLLLCVISAILVALYVRAGGKGKRRAVFAGIVGLLAFELITSAAAYNTTVAPEKIYPSTPSIEFLRRQPGPFRVVMNYDLGEGSLNTLAPFGIQNVGGYSSVYPLYSNKLLSLTQFPAGVEFSRWVVFHKMRSPLFDMLNAKFVLTAPGRGVPSDGLKLVHEGDMDIYENPGALPRAFAVHKGVLALEGQAASAAALMKSPDFDARKTVVLYEWPDQPFLERVGTPSRPPAVSVLRYEEDDIAVEADLSTAGWLVLSDAFYPGWEAIVDGRPAPILRANLACRAVALPAGRHRVDFRYRPASLRWGCVLTAAGACLVLAGVVVSCMMTSRGIRASTSSAPGEGRSLASAGDCR